jgi:hypothetical protein
MEALHDYLRLSPAVVNHIAADLKLEDDAEARWEKVQLCRRAPPAHGDAGHFAPQEEDGEWTDGSRCVPWHPAAAADAGTLDFLCKPTLKHAVAAISAVLKQQEPSDSAAAQKGLLQTGQLLVKVGLLSQHRTRI